MLSDLGLRALFSIYCAKGKDFDQFVFKEEMKELGFHNFLPIKFSLSWKFGEAPNQKISQKNRSKDLGKEDFQTQLFI